MDGHHCSSQLDSCEPEELGIAQSPPSSGSSGGGTGTKPSRRHLTAADSSASSSPSAKRSRRSVQKRVVTIPISETKGGAGEGAPPSDSWTWRKYGQKPIKGSPYPRGYYRCSSSKGCPARKQVERSCMDPSTIVVTYSFDHNHPWPISKSHHHHKSPAEAPEPEPEPIEEQPPLLTLQKQQEQLPQQHALTTESSPPESADRDEKFPDLVGDEESSLLMPHGVFNWFGDVGSPVSTSPAGSDELLYGSVFFGGPSETVTVGLPPEEEREESTSGAAGGCEDDALFAGLGELPEYSVVFRRGAASARAWMGSTNW